MSELLSKEVRCIPPIQSGAFSVNHYIGMSLKRDEATLLAGDYKLSAAINVNAGECRPLGVYLLYAKNNVLLYVGWSADLGSRVGSHLAPKGSNTAWFNHLISSIDIMYMKGLHRLRDDLSIDGDIEKYLIDILLPKFNCIPNSQGYRERALELFNEAIKV
jgi:hypothetical protein